MSTSTLSNPSIECILHAAGIQLFPDVHGQQHWTGPLSQDHVSALIAQVVRACADVARQHSLETTGLGQDYAGSVAVEQVILAHFDLD